MNQIYLEINDIMLSFIGTIMDSIVPDSIGLIGTLLPLFKGYSNLIYGTARDRAEQLWFTQVPEDIQEIIMNPEYLKDYVAFNIEKYSMGLSKILTDFIPGSAKNKLGYISDITAHAIHKGLSITFLFVNVFNIFAEINSDAYAGKYTEIDIKSFLEQECSKISTENIKEGVRHKIKKTVRPIETETNIGTEPRETKTARPKHKGVSSEHLKHSEHSEHSEHRGVSSEHKSTDLESKNVFLKEIVSGRDRIDNEYNILDDLIRKQNEMEEEFEEKYGKIDFE